MELAAGEVYFIVAGAFHPNVAAMGFDDLFRNRQPEAGMRPELLAFRPLGVKTVENGFKLAFLCFIYR